MTPITALRHHAETRPESTAFVMGKDVWSYARFAVEVDRLARGLIARGLRRGDRVALHLFNGPELAVAYHACFRIGAIAAPLNTRLKSAELDQLLRRLRPALYIGQANLYAKVAGVDPMNLPVNARFLVECGAAVMVPQLELTPPRLAELLRSFTREALLGMAQKARAASKPEATRTVAAECMSLAAA